MTETFPPSHLGIRQPADWEALHALECLAPPSPAISFDGTIGGEFDFCDIPIVLHEELENCELDVGVDYSENEPTSTLNLMVPSVSIDTCGTFGRQSRNLLETDTRLANTATLSPSFSIDGLSPTSAQFSSTDGETNRASVLSRFTVSAYLSPDMQARKKYLSPSSSDWTFPASPTRSLHSPPVSPAVQHFAEETMNSSAPSSPIPKYAALRTLSSASSTIISAIAGPPSPSPSIQMVEPIDWAAAIAAIPTRAARWFPSELPVIDSPKKNSKAKSSHPPKEQSATQTPPKSPKCTPHAIVAPTRKPADPPRRTLNAALKPATSFSVKVKHLPDALAWLKYLDLEFWLDQEYRTLPDKKHTRSTMRLMGYTAPDSSTHAGKIDLMTDALAEFKPAIRHSFTFHCHTTVESLPVLKRILILSDDPKDCISRQGLLSLRSNGVYSISGTETYDLTPPNPHGRPLYSKPIKDHHHPKLKWRFEYLVTDQRDANHDIVPEQKSVTPLSFTCSPGLLHPSSHGKGPKGMFDLFRKSLLPKIAAEKMQAPKPPKDIIRPSAQLVSQAHPTHTLTTRPIPTETTSKGIVRNIPINAKQCVPSIDRLSIHRRYHSSSTGVLLQGVRETQEQKYHKSDVSNPSGVALAHRPVRARAASIAALADVTNINKQHPAQRSAMSKGNPFSMNQRRRSVTAPDFKAVIRHIVPPAELDNLVSSSIPETNAPDTGITSLTPPNYHAKHRRLATNPISSS